MTGAWRALTLHQPWASLVALGVKTIETRSWATKYRGPLLIHAGVRRPRPVEVRPLAHALRLSWCAILDVGPHCSTPCGGCAVTASRAIPLGAALAACTLVDCVPMLDVVGTESHPGPWLEVGRSRPYLSLWRGPGSEVAERVDDQLPYGQFEPGRFAWLLADVAPLPEPIPVRGRQGLWSSAGLDAALADLRGTA